MEKNAERLINIVNKCIVKKTSLEAHHKAKFLEVEIK